MVGYLAVKFGQAIIALWGVATLVFFSARITGDPLTTMLPDQASLADFERVRALWGLDRPLYEQYGIFIVNALQGDFGQSTMFPRQDALSLVLAHLPATLSLGGVALLGAILVGLPLGIAGAAIKGKRLDYFGRGMAALGQAVPAFWLGIVLIWVFAVMLGIMPTSGRGTRQHYILPAIAMGAYPAAAFLRLIRNSMLEALGGPYVLLADSKGLSQSRMVLKHALKNAAAVPLTYFGITIGVLLTGSAVVETVFSWPGIGRLAVNAAQARDFAVVQVVTVLMAIIVIGVNLTIDAVYGLLDPRVRRQ